MSLLELLFRRLAMTPGRLQPRVRRGFPTSAQPLELRMLLSGIPAKFVDPHPEAGNQFGETFATLTNGNVVITAPNDDAGGGSAASSTGAGAVYLYNGQTGGLISTLTGSHAGDQLGGSSSFSTGGVTAIGVIALTNGNFVIDSPKWNGGLGAVTWGNGTSGVSGIVSAANSLVGSTSSDSVGFNGAGFSSITELSNGNYVVVSPSWNNGSVAGAGAVTWGNGTTGVSGVVSPANSLVGSTKSDGVGYLGVKALSNGNYVVDSPNWNNGSVASAGAVTWGNGTTGVTGVVSQANSLVGSTASDDVGINGVTALVNGNYVVDSANWNNGSVANAGAVTWGSGTTGVTGIVSPANSLVGSTASDRVGESGVTALFNGNYVVVSANWNNGSVANVGAVTWGSGTSGVSGIVSAANSLVGSTSFDSVGYNGITALSNGNYVVVSPNWNNGFVASAGAVTWGNGTTGVTGVVSPANSLVGSTVSDHVGYFGATALSNGNYVVLSPFWNNGSVAGAGAVTWGNGTTGVTGVVSQANSLVGTTASDDVGIDGVTALSNGNYVVDSGLWNNGSAARVGAVTWSSGTLGLTGPVSKSNSIIGANAGDTFGSHGITGLGNGNYLIYSQSSTGTNDTLLTFCRGITGVSVNSLTGGNDGFTISLDNPNNQFSVVDETNGKSYLESSATGFVPFTNNGPSILVSTYSSAIDNGTGSIDFGTSNFGTPLTQTFTVANYGNAPLIVQPVKAPAGFSIVTGKNFTVNQSIASGSSASFTLQFNATSAGTSSGTVTIGNNASTGSPFTFTVTGLTKSPKIAVQQGTANLANGTGTVDLGSTLVGTPVTQVITVSNSGNIPLTLTSVSVPSGFSIIAGINFSAGQSIAPGSSASFTLQLDAKATGSPSGIVTIGDNDATANPFTFNIMGTVTAPKILVQQGSTTLTNGQSTVNLGSTSQNSPTTTIITLTNNGNAPLVVQPVTAPAGFSVVSGTNFTPNQSIAIGASASFTLQLDATVTGASNGVVVIADSDTTASSFSLNVIGVVTAVGVTNPVLVVQQGASTLKNGTNTININSDPVGSAGSQVITVTNQGNAPLVLQSVTVPSGFSVVNFSANQSVAAGASASLTLQLNAKVTGVLTGVVTIQDNDPTASSFTFSVVANHRPTAISPSSILVATNQASATLVGGLTTTDPDSNAIPQTFTYSINSPTFLNGPTAVPVFSINGQGNLMLAAAAPVGVYKNVPISTTDQGGLSLTQNFTLYVTGTSTIGIAASVSVASGTPGGFAIANLPTSNNTAQNASGNSHAQLAAASTSSLSLSGFGNSMALAFDNTSQNSTTNFNVISNQLGVGGDNADFQIDSRGQLQTAITLDASVKRSYHLTIISTNTITGVSNIYPCTVTVVPVLKNTNVVTPATFTLLERSANGTRVGKVIANGVDKQPLTYAITGGNINGAFAINSTTGQITVANSSALLRTTNPTFALTVQATDSVSSGFATIAINLVTPATMTLSNNSILETASRGTIIGQFATTQPGSTNTYRYSLVPGKADNSRFKIDTNGNLTVNTGLNAALKNSYTIVVTSTDQNQQSITQTFQITILGRSNIKLSNNSIAKGSSIGTVIGQLTTTDAGNGNVWTYTLPSNRLNNADLTIDANGNLILNTNLSLDRRRVLRVDVVVTDQRGLSLNKLFAVILK